MNKNTVKIIRQEQNYKMLIRNKKQLLSKMDVHLNDMKLKERTNRMVVTNQLDISKRMEH